MSRCKGKTSPALKLALEMTSDSTT